MLLLQSIESLEIQKVHIVAFYPFFHDFIRLIWMKYPYSGFLSETRTVVLVTPTPCALRTIIRATTACYTNVPHGRVTYAPEWLAFAKTPPKSSPL